jgi:DNA-directed RNA polymerase subunit K/omega
VGLFRNLARIASAPVEIVDELIVKPLAEAVEEVADGYTGREGER